MFAFLRNLVRGVAQAYASGHTPETAQAAALGVAKAVLKVAAKRDQLVDELHAAQQARTATIAVIHADIAAFESIKQSL